MKALTTFSNSKYTDAELSIKAQHVVANMSGNVAFPNPTPGLDTLTAAASDFEEAEQASRNGSRELVAIKNQRRAVLEAMLREEANYVNLVAKGNLALIISSGFEHSKRAEPIGALPAPENLQVKPGLSKGSLQVSCNPVRGATAYCFDYCLLPGTSWERVDSTKHRVTITGLNSGQQYAFRVYALGTNPQRNWSAEVNSYVL